MWIEPAKSTIHVYFTIPNSCTCNLLKVLHWQQLMGEGTASEFKNCTEISTCKQIVTSVSISFKSVYLLMSLIETQLGTSVLHQQWDPTLF